MSKRMLLRLPRYHGDSHICQLAARTPLLRTIAFAWLLVGINSLTDAQMQTRNPTHQRIDSVFQSIDTSGSPGLAVIVLKGGKVAFQKGYGLANLATRMPISADTDFRLASFTKQFTATCIMLLVHDGKLSYDDSLTKIFPGFPSYGGTITVRMLLTHTSGPERLRRSVLSSSFRASTIAKFRR